MSFVCGVDARTPYEEIVTPLIRLFFGTFIREVILFYRIFRQVEELIGLVAVVVDILLGALDARQALSFVETTEHERAPFG